MAPRYGVEDQAAIRAANQARAAQQAQSDYLARVQAGGVSGQRISPDTAVAGAQAAGRVASGGQGPTMSQKSWEQMNPLEQATALSRVNWTGLEELVRSNQTPPTTQPGGSTTSTTTAPPTDTGAGMGAGAGAGAAATTASNTDQYNKLMEEALKVLQAQYGVSHENINAAIARMEADPYNRANAYAAMQLAPARVAADPLAVYMAASGLSDQQSAAAAQLAQAEADAYQQAMGNVQNVLQQSQEQANLSRLADIGLIRTGAQQDLEANLNMLRLGLEQQRIGGLTNMQQQNLQNALTVRNAIADQITSIFAGQNVAPESILKLIEAALSKINTNQWTNLPTMGA